METKKDKIDKEKNTTEGLISILRINPANTPPKKIPILNPIA